MKKFSAFLSEAERSLAAQTAEKLGLKHVSYGRYADPRGNVTHVSKDGKLVKLSAAEQGGTQKGGQEEDGEEEGGEDEEKQKPRPTSQLNHPAKCD